MGEEENQSKKCMYSPQKQLACDEMFTPTVCTYYLVYVCTVQYVEDIIYVFVILIS